MSNAYRNNLRAQTVDLFYHGYDNYLQYAFPEDELRPLTCGPLTRDRANPKHIELNDVLGNYSLTLIDSLSTLAILASDQSGCVANDTSSENERCPLRDFQDGVQLLVEYYGDGTDGPKGQGKRARGFDLDSKVQVFETVIRGVGGLLSAHLFAVGELPIRGYKPEWIKDEGIHWENGFVYDGQFLRLAKDLAERLLPAFVTPTNLPYPRVNLRSGVQMYRNSPLNANAETGQCPNDATVEITETCSAGAGSLVLEFTTLSRLLGDDRFEVAAKKAFWAVWKRRSSIDLIGAGIDAESGQWINAYTGVGAGIDSFFEYAFKSHILLSGLSYDRNESSLHSPEAFLSAWKQAHSAIKRHVYRSEVFQHPHYIQSDLYTGAARAFWVDSLGAYYPGLLTLSGELEEATATHMLYTALWSKYSALPERWSTYTGDIEQGLRWWGGRPEFIESSWYLYRATKDPWYLHVGEMALADIQRRCWTRCGWAGLQDVKTGELSDRMESFFLGETAKYLYLLFDDTHPLNTLDAPFVFTTEGHPLIVPRHKTGQTTEKALWYPISEETDLHTEDWSTATCPAPPKLLPLTISPVAARRDIFHAATLARLELPIDRASISQENMEEILWGAANDSVAHTNAIHFFPWTIPASYIPANGVCAELKSGSTFDLVFPTYEDSVNSFTSMYRVTEGIMLNTLSGMKLAMVRENDHLGENFRIYSLQTTLLGRDEKVFMSRAMVATFNPLDPYFTRVRDGQVLDLLIDYETNPVASEADKLADDLYNDSPSATHFPIHLPGIPAKDDSDSNFLSSLVQSFQFLLGDSPEPTIPPAPKSPILRRRILIAGISAGPGAAPVPTLDNDPPTLGENAVDSPLIWRTIYFSPHNLCTTVLDASIPRTHTIIVVPRGDCSFATKLQHIPSFPPSSSSLQLVIVLSNLRRNQGSRRIGNRIVPIQPHLHAPQLTPAGIVRANPIPMVLVEDGEAAMEYLKRAKGVAVRRKWWYESQGTRVDNLIVL
ncbi:seven-hairpin glycosidase [Microthyrium microscopicum]|uniref:alpha-1,2-Mannosidase n=1 Tax=Microthyrium microscopicum TaxID=703497 RepID=A0A6A6UC31_9PEZI|nr:seven-hairpin glycosidase [Microthyrium microscopicum]